MTDHQEDEGTSEERGLVGQVNPFVGMSLMWCLACLRGGEKSHTLICLFDVFEQWPGIQTSAVCPMIACECSDSGDDGCAHVGTGTR